MPIPQAGQQKRAASLAAAALPASQSGPIAHTETGTRALQTSRLLVVRNRSFQQRLGRVDLLRFLQSFLGHFALPHSICPAGHSGLHAKSSPKFSCHESPRKCLVLLYIVFQRGRGTTWQPCYRVELVSTPLIFSTPLGLLASHAVDRATALHRPAPARNLFRIRVKLVVQSQFFSRLYPPAAEKNHAPPHSAVCQVRLAAMIDQFGSTATHGSVDHPSLVEPQQINPRM